MRDGPHSGTPDSVGPTIFRPSAVVGRIAVGCGPGLLGILSDHDVAPVAVANWVLDAACYTPLKWRTAWQLPVGAVAGAMPMLIGGRWLELC